MRPVRTKLRRIAWAWFESSRVWGRMKANVIVVEAGPAGCSAAYHAARAGLEVLLLDQHESRQDRADGEPCSRGRSPRCH